MNTVIVIVSGICVTSVGKEVTVTDHVMLIEDVKEQDVHFDTSIKYVLTEPFAITIANHRPLTKLRETIVDKDFVHVDVPYIRLIMEFPTGFV